MIFLILIQINIKYSRLVCGIIIKLILYFINYKKICYFKIYILGYLFDKNHESYYYIYAIYTNNNYCSTHVYVIYNTQKKTSCNYRFTCYINLLE
ncbi:hypothetical protein PFFVO_06195 [Plasmodium falciparum Vietnam Oak-Knoll (FVO)]|uniref:Uncharacterized protein n=1 Tax=Plasmodium falciparum Vietnam Oak-Knoll (FVO) TaxID=1036723 RepID=A0A024UVR4_PLAFA|nr:hypothetical protein PFFVO_06195 [Plasmodium falciparum Vietnam Oak-Knoll (FVO)]